MTPATMESLIFAVALVAFLVVLAWLKARGRAPVTRVWKYGFYAAAVVASEVIAACVAGVSTDGPALMTAFLVLAIIYAYFHARDCPTCGTPYFPKLAHDAGKPFCSRCGTRLVPEAAKKATASPLD